MAELGAVETKKSKFGMVSILDNSVTFSFFMPVYFTRLWLVLTGFHVL